MLHKPFVKAAALALALLALPLTAALAQDDTNLNAIEMIGVVETFDASALTINGQVIDITAAEIKVPLEVGLAVKVEGALQPDGSIAASEVKAAEAGLLPGELEVIGALTSLDAATAVIAGFSFDVTAAEIGDGVAVGEIVKVHASLVDDVWVAREVELFVAPEAMPDDAPDHEGEFEIIGTLEQFDSASIVVSGLTIDITHAEIKDTLVVGMVVKVHVSLVDGVLVAREVENAFEHLREQEREEERERHGDDDSVTLPPDCAPRQPAGWVAYVAQPGDTLTSLAHLLDVDLSDLMLANCIADPNGLPAGSVFFGPAFGDDDHGSDNSGRGSDDSGHDSDDDHGDDSSGHGSDDSDSHGDSSGHGGDDDDDHGGHHD